jgi:hypothetical protein
VALYMHDARDLALIALHRWVVPTEWKSADDMGKWEWTAGKWYADASDKGIQTSPDAKFHGT